MTTIHRGGNLARQAVLTLLTFLVASGYLFTEIVAASAAVREPDTEIPHGDQWSSRHLLSAGEGQFPWLDEGADDTDSYVPLHRQRRSADNSTGSKSIWEEIEEFYSDKNNMAMYCVLPIMVLVYGGCSAIYCVHKCRQYLRRRKHKRLKEDDCDSLTSDKNNLNVDDTSSNNAPDKERTVSQISQAWADMQADGGGNIWSAQTDPVTNKSPLPWHTNDKVAAASALAYTSERERANTSSRAAYLQDKLREDDISLEEGRRSQVGVATARSQSRNSYLEDRLGEEEARGGGQKSHADNRIQVVAATTTATTVASSSTDDDILPGQESPTRHQQQQQQQQQQHRHQQLRQQPLPVVRAVSRAPGEESRTAVNLSDYATNRSTAVKATDYSRFSDSKPIEIIPLSADPSLRVWDPLHNRPFGERQESARNSTRMTSLGAEAGPSHGRTSVQAMKDEMLARYDALSTFQMAKKAAEILKTNAVEKSPFQRKPNKKKHIFIAE